MIQLCTSQVDYAFSPTDDNSAVYDALARPLVDLGLSGGVATLFAYGQTGSGKTHTISGVLERIGEDLFGRQKLGEQNRPFDGESFF